MDGVEVSGVGVETFEVKSKRYDVGAHSGVPGRVGPEVD